VLLVLVSVHHSFWSLSSAKLEREKSGHTNGGAVGVGVGVFDGVGVGVFVGVGLGVFVGVLLGVGVFVGVLLGVGEGPEVDVGPAVGTSVSVGVEVRLANGEGLGEPVAVTVPVTLRFGVDVVVGVLVGVPVAAPGTVGTGLLRLSTTSSTRESTFSSSGSRSRITASTILILRLRNRPGISSFP
jgi:hypothetical protein